jgi:hypothetical protein
MSVGLTGGLASSVAGTSLAQTAGTEVDRAQQAASAQHRRVQNVVRAENASGIGQADGDDHETGERDANGRRAWEEPPQGPQSGGALSASDRQSKDASRQSGNLVDLTG